MNNLKTFILLLAISTMVISQDTATKNYCELGYCARCKPEPAGKSCFQCLKSFPKAVDGEPTLNQCSGKDTVENCSSYHYDGRSGS
jgi:hypothetical protein